MPFIKAFKEMVRRRPFLVQRLEEVLKKLLTSCEFFDDDGRKKIAISAPPALAFLALPPPPHRRKPIVRCCLPASPVEPALPRQLAWHLQHRARHRRVQ